jgi:mannan endo-1,4-beta-mannosidase
MRRMSDIYLSVGKPSILTGFGLVTQSNAPNFVPFNTTVAPFASENRKKLLQQVAFC